MAFWPGLFARPAAVPQDSRPSYTLFFLLCGAFGLTLVPHAWQFPFWLTATVIVVTVIRGGLEVYRLPMPSLWLSAFFAVVYLGLILVQYGTIAGREAGTAFAAGLLAIKFYEIRRPRDLAVIVFACCFMVMSSLLYSQVLELFVYCLIMMWVLTALLLRLYIGDTQEDRLLPTLKTSGLIFLQALPLALFLFVFFPRYQGNLSFPMGDAKIGLSDTVSPGSVAKLAQDDREAMYVEFKSKFVPTPDSMYFRALVLWDYNNGVWTAGPTADQTLDSKLPPPGSEVVQQFNVLAHNQRWLFALDVPVTKPNNPEIANWASLNHGNIIQLPFSERLNHTTRYTVTSSFFRPEETISDREFNLCTQLPRDTTKDAIDPEVRALADQLHAGVPPDNAMSYVYNVLKYFHQQGFIYTANPGPQGPEWLKDFLLTRKSGFCEHFASAFAVMMRLKGIPVRVVVGYLGGDYNPYSGKWVVSQSNAHAWTEVWVPAKGAPEKGGRGKWLRIDPTASIGSVEPGQMSHANDAADSLTAQVNHRPPNFMEKYLPKWLRDGLREFQLRREQVEAGWDDLVFSYDPQVQARLAEALGFRGSLQTVFGLAAMCVVVAAAFYFGFRQWVGRRRFGSPVESLYATFCRRMAQRGLPRASWEGPLAYTERVAEAFPEDKDALENVGLIVARARYGPAPADAATPEKLKALLNELSASQAAGAGRQR